MYVIKHKNGKYLAQTTAYDTNPFFFSSNKNDNKIMFFMSIKEAKSCFKQVIDCKNYGFKNEVKNCKIVEIKLHDRFEEI